MILWQTDQGERVLSNQSSCTCLLQRQPKQGCCPGPALNHSPYFPLTNILSLLVYFDSKCKDFGLTGQSIGRAKANSSNQRRL